MADADEVSAFGRLNGRNGLFVRCMGRRWDRPSLVEGVERQGAFPSDTNKKHPHRSGEIEAGVGENERGLVLDRLINTDFDRHAHSSSAFLSGLCRHRNRT